MKKSLIYIVSFILLLMCSCNDDAPIGPDVEVEKPTDSLLKVLTADTLRILDIGNSYTEDYTYLLPNIVENLGGDMKHVCYYNLIRASGSFLSWYNCYRGKDNIAYYCKKMFGDIDQNVPTGDFEAYDSAPFQQVLSQPWDLIVLHQVSNYSTDYDLWYTTQSGGFLNELLSLLKELQPKAHFAFVLTHSYEHTNTNNKEKSTYLRWQHIAEAASKLMAYSSDFICLLPYGTAIENLRFTSINNVYDLTRDGTHVGRGLPRYAAALSVYQTLFYPRTGRSIADCTVTYTCPQWEIEGSKYPDGCIDVTSDNAHYAIDAALAACEAPYECGSN